MQKLLQAVTDIVSNTPPSRVRQLADRIRRLSGPDGSMSLGQWAATPGAKERLSGLVQAWRLEGTSPNELAGILTGASYAYHQALSESETELVWTGPSSEFIPTRQTEQVLLEVIDSACTKLFLTSFVVYDVATIMAALSKALDRGVAVSLLLESSSRHGGGVSIDGIRQVRNVLPDAQVFFWRNKEVNFAGGKVHAKVAVCDERVCFVSSANLTGHGMERNMETGILVRGGTVPWSLHRHLESLVTIDVIGD